MGLVACMIALGFMGGILFLTERFRVEGGPWGCGFRVYRAEQNQ